MEKVFRNASNTDDSLGYPVASDDINVLVSPSDFHSQLIDCVSNASTQISICSLYLGTGPLAQELIDTIVTQCNAKPTLKVSIVLDYSRGQRGHPEKSSLTMLEPLLAAHPTRVSVGVFKVPKLKRMVYSSLPSPLDETVGVSHVKAYVFDDKLIMSGANLSEDYFTDRQDRYIKFQNAPGLVSFYHSLTSILKDSSYKCSVVKDRVVINRNVNEDHGFKKQVVKLLASIPTLSKTDAVETSLALPTIQFTPLGINNDKEVVCSVFKKLPENVDMHIASGYLNFPPFFVKMLCNTTSLRSLNVLTASPEANGFFNGNGMKAAIPMAYTLIEKKFYRKLRDSFSTTSSTSSTSWNIKEYSRQSWTFHAKGLWCCARGKKDGRRRSEMLTVIGSSNFGRRSYERDLESQILLYSSNQRLQEDLRNEVTRLESHCTAVNDATWDQPDRKLKGWFKYNSGRWIRPVTKLISSFL